MKPFTALIALTLAACTAADLPDGETGKDTPRAPRAEDPSPADALLRIGPDGAGQLTGGFPFTVQAAERAFPGYEVVSAGDAETPALQVRRPGSEAAVFIITPDWTRGFAGAVSTGDSAVAGPGGIRAGVTRLGGVPDGLKTGCAVPDEPAGESLVCETASFRLEFQGTGEEALLTRQTWLPPAPQ